MMIDRSGRFSRSMIPHIWRRVLIFEMGDYYRVFEWMKQRADDENKEEQMFLYGNGRYAHRALRFAFFCFFFEKLTSGSRPVVGSSMITIFGSPTSAAAIESLLRMPPLSSFAFSPKPSPSSCTFVAAKFTAARRCAGRMPFNLAYSKRCSRTVNSGH